MTNSRFSPFREFNKGYAIVGTVVSALSLASLIQKYLDVGLKPIVAEFLAYYHKVIGVLTTPIVAIMPFSVPDWYRDAYVLSFVMLLAETRAVFMTGVVRENVSVPFFLRLNWIAVFIAVAGSIMLLGLLAIVWKPLELSAIVNGEGSAHERRRTRYSLLMFATAWAIAVAFFALNSQL